MARSEGGDRFMWLLVIILVQTIAAADSISDNSLQPSVRWVTSEFGPCSGECGSGVQVRTVRCVRNEDRQTEQHEVPVNLCPLPSPAETQSCNSLCMGQWTKGEWSECSKTCGTGTQTRDVKCQSSSWRNQLFEVSSTQCVSQKPDTSRACYLKDCPDSETSESSSILSENYTLIQIHRAKKIRVTVGGQVNLLPGQTVVIKCPVKHFSKKLVYWSKGYRLIPFMGRVKTTSAGLHIENASPETDVGEYTCNAGDLSAKIKVQFIKNDDPLIKSYKTWIRKSKHQQKYHPLNTKKNGKQKNTAVVNNGGDELNQQRDESKNSSHFLMYVTQDWSSCNATCGSAGQQQRYVTCSYVTPKYVKIVSDSECNYVGLEKPETTRECSSGTKCAVWRPGSWSQCRPSCGKTGHMHRLLTCVWESSGQFAWSACDLKSKPAASKPCKTRPCPSECSDESRFCSLASLLKLCRYYHFRTQCCRTCQKHDTPYVTT